MNKIKRTLMSMIVFLTMFCLTAIFNIHLPFYTNEGVRLNVNDTITTKSQALVEETQEIEIQSFSYSINQTVDQYLESNDTPVSQAKTDNDQENYLLSTQTDAAEEVLEDSMEVFTQEQSRTAIMSAPSDELSETSITSSSTENASSETEEVEEPQPEALYSNIGISVAESFVNIREEASTEGSVLGKLYRDSAAEILDTKGDWYYVESGSVKGYVKSEYIKTGISDAKLIEKYSKLRISVEVDGLNVREEPTTESKKLTVIYQNETFPVIELKDDWVKIDITDDNVIGYIKTEFAEVLVDFTNAISKEEEQKILQLEAEARAKKETEVKYRDEVNCSAEDIKLLACLVHSEAGTQSYEGKLAVANIVLNRVKSSKYANTIKGVIYQSGQFSVAASGSLAKQLANFNNYSSNSQQLSIKAAKAALEGANNIGSRLYFHTYKSAVSKGYDEKSTSVKLGDHLFW
ncbi:MAG: SH3 domain-containing protein [Mobilitalea sp.]